MNKGLPELGLQLRRHLGRRRLHRKEGDDNCTYARRGAHPIVETAQPGTHVGEQADTDCAKASDEPVSDAGVVIGAKRPSNRKLFEDQGIEHDQNERQRYTDHSDDQPGQLIGLGEVQPARRPPKDPPAGS